MPSPPAIVNAPLLVPVELVVVVIATDLLNIPTPLTIKSMVVNELRMLIALVVVAPLLVTDCNVAVLHTTTSPVDVLTAVSVPAFKLVTAKVPMVAVVRICAPVI